jgi:hypothetical protein
MILDTLAGDDFGLSMAPGKMAIGFARMYQGDKVATIPASNLLCGPIEAALCQRHAGALGLRPIDTHPPSQSHPGCSVVPFGARGG